MTRMIKYFIIISATIVLSGCNTVTRSKQVNILGEWIVEDIAQTGVIDNSRTTLSFTADGQISGLATCNRMASTYTQNGNRLRIAPPALTRMMCAPALMNQERKLVQQLTDVRRMRLDATGALLLDGDDGVSVLARRP